MSATRHACLLFVALFSLSALAFAEAPATTGTASARPAPKRRAAKHDQARSAAVKGARVHVIDEVIIVGRPQRPLSVLDTSAQSFRFPTGTARYSERDRRFVPPFGSEGW